MSNQEKLSQKIRRESEILSSYMGPPELSPCPSYLDLEDWADAVEDMEAEVEQLRTYLATLAEATEQACVEMSQAADKCDGWAEQSVGGGWSTHQVKPNRELADTLRRRASMTRRALPVIETTAERAGEGA